MSIPPRPIGRIFPWIALLALTGTLTVLAGAALYVHFGNSFLDAVNKAASRPFVAEGERLSRAGEPEKAIASFDMALHAGFGYPSDRTRTLALKGLALWQLGNVREAAETLAASVAGSAPDFRGAQALVEALLQLRRISEAESVVSRWRDALPEDTPPQVRANLLYCAGRVAQEKGELPAAQSAYEESAATVPGGLAEYRLALLAINRKDPAGARAHWERFMLCGAVGPEAEIAREHCASLASASLSTE